MLKKIILTLVVFTLAIAIWIATDVYKNAQINYLPAKPEVKLKTRDNDALYALHRQLPFDFSQLKDTYTKLNNRFDTADFSTPSLIRLIYDYKSQIPTTDFALLKETLLNFKYWMDQPGQDSMCYWSENHQILFASAEYLIGSYWPSETFTNTGKIGEQHKVMGRERVLIWLEQRWLYGFAEWYSNTYYAEDVAPLINLIDYGDEEVSVKAKIILDLLMHDIATQSYKGIFVASSGRMYEGGKREGDGRSMKRLIGSVWGDRYGFGEEKGMMQNFNYSKKYQVPEVIKSIGFDDTTQVIKATNGLNLTELSDEDLIGQQDRQIMMQWAMESFTNPEIVANTVDYIQENNMFTNEFLHDLKALNIGFLNAIGALPTITRQLKLVSDGIAIQRANTYTYKTPDFMITTAQAYQPGTYGDQQHLWNAILDKGVSIFTTHPAVPLSAKGALSLSPGYWVGNGTLPHVAQHKNVVLNIYKIPKEAGFMGRKPAHYTHAHFPKDEFDEVIIDGRYAFGRLGHKFVAFTAKNKLFYSKNIKSRKIGEKESSYDLIQEGRDTYWIFEASTQAKEHSFKQFIERIKSNKVIYENSKLRYGTLSDVIELQYKNNFIVNHQVIDTQYKRFDSAYASVERKANTMLIQHEGKSLFLDFYNQIREEQ
ncbi:hypothetical protein [Thalassotalea profundi]|uniref:Uncharacterized protein n=1 Tax=Thalassotalea profundi TaxID=2036687 RepID=A0ABQ3IQD7_9GAMM|nr:hypothetical protein [Thalassotalea profundi]GHE91323.1 hypothetical protein GCM10011501_21060 [Thalassotalea profundi]